MKFKVIDVRSDNVLFENTDREQCEEFWEKLWDEDSTTAIYSTIEEIEAKE